jgi:Helitron helicase-like domain at N-terminus
VILDLTEFLHQYHSYVKNLKMAMEKLTGPELKLVIRADKVPQGEHRGRYNAPAVEEISVVMAGDPAGSRDIVLTQRDGQLHDIRDTNRAYDCLQYPFIFWNGQDGYHFGIPLRDPTTKQPMQKTMSSMQFYSFHLMPQQGDNNVLLRFKDLLSQFIVNMYVKIESECLAFIRTHQRQLRAHSYIHLQDAIR